MYEGSCADMMAAAATAAPPPLGPGSHDLRLPMTNYGGEPSHSLVDYPTSPFSYSPPQSMSPLSASQNPSEAYHDPFSPLPTDYDISLQNPSPVCNQNSTATYHTSVHFDFTTLSIPINLQNTTWSTLAKHFAEIQTQIKISQST